MSATSRWTRVRKFARRWALTASIFLSAAASSSSSVVTRSMSERSATVFRTAVASVILPLEDETAIAQL